LIGAAGETRTIVFASGKVMLGDEEWDATSQAVISVGRRVRKAIRVEEE
jgi:membrane-bound ClpP family serine protease